MNGKSILVIGAGGATGQEVTKLALKQGYTVRATERDWSSTEFDPDGAECFDLDVLDADFSAAMEGVDCVISCLGVGNDAATLLDPPPIYTDGVRNIIANMKRAGCDRLIVISATFVETADRGPLHFKLTAVPALQVVFSRMREMETILKIAKGIRWTAVRPGWLLDAPMTQDYVVQADVIPQDMIRTRHADLAHFMVSQIDDDTWVNATPAISRAEPPENTSIDEVIKEIVG